MILRRALILRWRRHLILLTLILRRVLILGRGLVLRRIRVLILIWSLRLPLHLVLSLVGRRRLLILRLRRIILWRRILLAEGRRRRERHAQNQSAEAKLRE